MKNTIKKYLIILLFLPAVVHGQQDSIVLLTKSHLQVGSESPVHSITLYLEKERPKQTYHKAFFYNEKEPLNSGQECAFRIASTSKLFTATLILQLVDEGKLSLDEKALPILNTLQMSGIKDIHQFEGKNYTSEITIRQLLQHRTGLCDIFNDRESEFFSLLLENPQKQYSPQLIIDLYHQYGLEKTSHFTPGKNWFYSDMNYVLLGLILEAVEGEPLHQLIRNRILKPLKMQYTYFEFYEPAIEVGFQQKQYVGTFNFTEINTSFDWAGGGLVSTHSDLARFIKALFNEQLITDKQLKEMIEVRKTQPGESRYGLGIYETQYNDKVFYGHYGFYGSYVGYCPTDNLVISYSISQAMPDFFVYKYISSILRYFGQEF